MKLIKYICDCCKKEYDFSFKVKLPTICINDEGEKYWKTEEFDICENCANKIVKLFEEV